jgi:tetratricopeptide (TPR) repeat protein
MAKGKIFVGRKAELEQFKEVRGIIVPVILHFLKNQEGHSERVDVGDIEGDGTVIGDDAHVTVDKRRGVDPNLLLDRAIKEAVAKGRAIEQAEQLKEQLAKAVERGEKIVAEGNRPDAEIAIEKLYESGDIKLLQKLLIKDRDEHRDALIQRNREIAAVAYLRGDIDIAREAVNEILKVLPEDLFALNRRGIIHSLQGKLKESECDFKRVLELANEKGNNKDRAVALSNLGNRHGLTLTFRTLTDTDSLGHGLTQTYLLLRIA